MNYIAERKLQYSEKGSTKRNTFFIRISEPFFVEQSMVSFPLDGEIHGCKVDIDGLDETYPDVYGADALQAVNLASNVESMLKRLQKKYDIFWFSGEPYFDD